MKSAVMKKLNPSSTTLLHLMVIGARLYRASDASKQPLLAACSCATSRLEPKLHAL